MREKLNQSIFFEEIYCFILCFVSLICWRYNSMAGMIILILISTLALILFNDFKYMIPGILYFIFSNSAEFEMSDFPIPLIICGAILLIVVILYIVKNGIHLKKVKAYRGFLFLSISCILPVLWHNIIGKGQEVLYFIYFTYILYLVVYVFFSSSLKMNSFHMLVVAMEYMTILLSFECLYGILNLYHTNPTIADPWYPLGWGLCNEAGIMICMGIPFIFIKLIKADNLYKIMLQIVKIAVASIGILLTTSRGSILFGVIEIVLLLIASLFLSKKKVSTIICLSISIGFALFLVQYIYGIPKLFFTIKDMLFYNGLKSEARLRLWKQAIELWKQDFVRMTFGSGMVAEFTEVIQGGNSKIIYAVYHSTFFECLVAFGNLGVAFLIIHFIEKYKQLKVLDKSIFVVMFIGYLIVDLYGMMDNTYGMYYYMLPLTMIMGCLDNVEKKNFSNLFS